MSGERSPIRRREFLRAGTLAAASAISIGSSSLATGPKSPTSKLPTRKLGKTGIDVTILSQETSRTAVSLDRLARVAYANGVRSFDTADCYVSSETSIAKWMRFEPDVRGNIFLVTKDHPRLPSQMMAMLDRRLAALETDHVDLYFIHSLGNSHTLDEAIALVRSKELKTAIEAIKRSGKAKLVGFSTHHKERARIVAAAAEGGFVDAIMLQHTAWLEKDGALDRALDAAHGRGIGLIAMKPIAGVDPGRFLAEVSSRMPWLKENGLSPFQGLLHAIWSDERISSCSISMKNTDQIREYTDAARRFELLAQTEIQSLRKAIAGTPCQSAFPLIGAGAGLASVCSTSSSNGIPSRLASWTMTARDAERRES